jgi:hypothetical protein
VDIVKSFEEIREDTNPEYLEERLLRKGSGLVLYATAKRRGDKSETHFKTLKDVLNTNAGASLEQQVRGLSHAMEELSKGLIEQRHQIGAVAALATAALMINEKKTKRR